jgi:hypothetical protein
MSLPKTSIEQRSMLAAVDHGGRAQAATALHRNQSAVTFALPAELAISLVRSLPLSAVLVSNERADLGPGRRPVEGGAIPAAERDARFREGGRALRPYPTLVKSMGTGALTLIVSHLSRRH